MARKNQEVEEILTPDPFLDQAKRGAEWFEANWKIFAGLLGAILLGVIGFELAQDASQGSASAVTAELTEALDDYSKSTDLRTVLTSTDSAKLKEGWTKAREKLSTFRKAHADRDAARVAALYEADLARRLEAFGDAANLYAEYLASAKPSDPLLYIAHEGAGYAREGEGKLDEALAEYEKLLTAAPYAKDYALKNKARVLEKKGDAAGAKAAYQGIVDMDPASELKSFAEDKLKALQ
jgi:tetratricopeptide (TPR) repeat protein